MEKQWKILEIEKKEMIGKDDNEKQLNNNQN